MSSLDDNPEAPALDVLDEGSFGELLAMIANAIVEDGVQEAVDVFPAEWVEEVDAS